MLRDDYLPGVPCWVDLTQADMDRTTEFYEALLGWGFDVRTPADAPRRYAYAVVDGATVAGVGSPPAPGTPAGWTTFVRVDDATDTAAAVVANGGEVLSPPAVSPAGRAALCADPHGAVIGLWEPNENRGAQLVNAPGAWNFSELHTPDPDGAARFYGEVFGWVCDRFDMGADEAAWLWRRPGYGAFLAESDPDAAAFQASGEAPDGFADAVAWMVPYARDERAPAGSWWTTTFGVADAHAAFTRALELGAEAVEPLRDTAYTRDATVRDPQGAVVILSEYRPPTSV